MRCRLISFAAVAAAAGVWAAPAQATFHLEMVNEVMLASSSGDPGTQFVELLDNGGTEEQFTPVFAPYKLVVYDAAGNQLGEQTLNPTGLRGAAAADTEYLISTAAADSAFGVTGDERLMVTLPSGAGQICFNGSEPAPQSVSCITYGTITKPVAINSNGSGSNHGPVPPNGESDQLQPNGSVVAAAPTPKAKNRSGSGPPTPGQPSLSRASLTGLSRGKAQLRFTATPGAGEPELTGIAIGLPHGLSFSAVKLAKGLKVTAASGSQLPFASRLVNGTLQITLRTAAGSVSVTAGAGAIRVSKQLAKRAKHHHIKQLRFTATVTDSGGRSTKLVASVKAS